MTGRFVDLGIRILVALALLSSPIRPARASHPIPSPDDLPGYLVVISHGTGGGSAMWSRPSLREAAPLPSGLEDGLDADLEDELTAKSSPATASFAILPFPCHEPHGPRVGLAVAMTARPLRC